MAKGSRTALGAFAPPQALAPAAQKGKKGSTAAKNDVHRLMDAFGIGIYAQGEQPRKITAGKKTKKGLRRYSGPYTADSLLRFARDNTAFGAYVMAMAVAPSIPNGGQTLERARQTVRTSTNDPIKYTIALADKMLSINPEIANSWQAVSKNANDVADGLAMVANDTETHPLDIYDMFDVVLNQSVVHAYPMKIRRQIFTGDGGDAKRLAPTNLLSRIKGLVGQGNEGQLPAIVTTIERASRRFNKSSLAAYKQVAAYLANVRNASSYTGFSYLRGAKPMAAPTSVSGTADDFGVSDAVYGFEVMGFVYYIDDQVTPDGKPVSSKAVSHQTAASKLASQVGADEYPAALTGPMSFAPAGRLFLCYSDDTKSMFFATDRSPSRKLLLIGEQSPRDAVLFGENPDQPLTGFVV